jgi:hypothetical protein
MGVTLIAFDCGLKGGICIIKRGSDPEVHKMPIKSIVHNRKKKNVYDLDAIKQILQLHVNGDTHAFIEKQSPRPNEGSVSSFTAGAGFGSLQGLCIGLGIDTEIILPSTWKKHFPALNTANIILLKDQLKIARKKKYTKDMIALNKKIKSEAKDAARVLASQMYPKLKDSFKYKVNDGLAESLLMGIYKKESEFEDEFK